MDLQCWRVLAVSQINESMGIVGGLAIDFGLFQELLIWLLSLEVWETAYFRFFAIRLFPDWGKWGVYLSQEVL